MSDFDSLWGEEFVLPSKKKQIEKVKVIKDKIDKPEQIKTVKKKSTVKMTLKEQVAAIAADVLETLGKQKDNFIVIDNYDQYIDYIKAAIKSGGIAIDTETNNTLDYINCKLMGLCLYYPGGKSAYVPVNHVDIDTRERLSWQLNEQQIAEGLKLVYANRPKFVPRYEDDFYGDWYREVILPRLGKDFPITIFQNGKFDYQVLKCTCGVECPCDWDTLLGTKLLDENTFRAGLKEQYSDKIDPDQKVYHIESLFQGLEYAIFDPYIFAYYAATDALMTWRLYQEYQLPLFKQPDNARLYKLAIEVEMPCVQVTAEMELAGVVFDKEYSERLKNKYHAKLNVLNEQLKQVLTSLEPTIKSWRETPEANAIQWKKQSEKQRDNALKSANYDETLWKNVQGVWYKKSKSKVEQLDDEVTTDSLGSPTQLGIILYDILKCPIVDKEKPQGTGDPELELLKAKHVSPDIDNFIVLIQQSRELNKLITSFIDSLPEKINPKDGRIHGSFHQYGTATGRFSSSEPNLQQVPSHCKEIRMLFKSDLKYNEVESLTDEGNTFTVSHIDDLNTLEGWKNIKNIKINDFVELDDNLYYKIIDINPSQNNEEFNFKIDLNSVQQIPTEINN